MPVRDRSSTYILYSQCVAKVCNKSEVRNTYLGTQPRRSESQDSLDGNVYTGGVEGLEEDFGGVFPVLRRVQGRFSLSGGTDEFVNRYQLVTIWCGEGYPL